MCKYISVGNIKLNYKYILFYVISQLINKILLKKKILQKIGIFDVTLIDSHKIIQEICNYIGLFLISLFLLIAEKSQKKRKKQNEENILVKKTYSASKLIYIDQLERNISLKKIILIIFLLFLEAQSNVTFYACGLDGLDYWVFEILFVYLIFSKILITPMYKHQKCSVLFIIFFCTLLKIISNIIDYFDNTIKIYKTYKIIIPIGIIIFLLISFLRAYVSCKIKWLMDLKYISPNILLMLYGIIGIIICSIICTITTFVPCEDVIISYNEMIKICRQNKTIFYNNNTEIKTLNYYDSFSIYYEKLCKGDIFKNICLIIMKVLVNFLVKFFSILILKYLNPFFFIIASSIYFFFYRLINIIFPNKDNENGIYIEFIAEIFSIIGILVYTELIELNFCELNYNLKKNIIKRSLNDYTNLESDNSNNSNTLNESENKINDTEINLASIDEE